MTSPHLGPKQNLIQNIKYTGSETEFSTELKGEKVIVHCNQGVHNHGSSKVKLTDKIDYNWEFRYYHGNLVAAHINGKVIAYGMKGKDGGMVRVTNQETNCRTLIKNLKDDIKDVSFAFSRKEIILGCIDSEGNILIYQIDDTPLSISYTLLLHIYRQDSERPKSNFRLIWCSYIPSFEDDLDSNDDFEKMFVILNGNKAEVYNVGILTAKYGLGGPIDPDDSYEGYVEIKHTSEIVDASFSSDGTALAIGSTDGYVKFFQLYMYDNEKQKCLHEWLPHDGEPLSSVIFIDNLLECSSECWKFTITGANNNTEIKLWSCESWTCLQTIVFKSDPSSLITSLYLNVKIDYTGRYLFISDINNRVFYMLELQKNDKEQTLYVTNLSQFLLTAPFLSYFILEATKKKIPFCYNQSTEDLYEDRDDYDEDSEITVNFLKMLVIQPKKFQECNITFQTDAIYYNTTLSDLSCDMDEETAAEKVPKLDDLQDSVTLLIQQQSNLTLMTPDDFTSPGHDSRPNSVRNSLLGDGSITKSVENLNDSISVVDNLIDFQRPQKDNFASEGSSPSREVQEILSLNNSTYSTQDYFDNLTKQEEPQKVYDNDKDALIFAENNGELLWPKIPVVNENKIIKDESFREKDLLNSAEDLSQLQAINYRISSLETIIREQNILIHKMHEDRLDKDLLVKELVAAMSKQHLQLGNMLENMASMQKTNDRESKEQIVTSVGQLLNKQLAEKLQQIISQEMKHVILPAMHNLTETYRKQVDGHYGQKLANTDAMLKENVAKAFNSKALSDTLSLSVVSVVAPSLEKCYKDIIASSLIPSWERVCGQMFQQINETFTKGTKEYTASVESYMDRQRKVQEKGKDLIVQMQAVSDTMKSNADKLTSNLTSEIHKQFNAVFKSMQDKLTHSVKEIVAEQVNQGFKSHAAVIEDSVINAVRSRAVTPSPHVDSHVATSTQIQQHLTRGNFRDAFQLALSAENLNYVIYVCERTEVSKLFGEECLLQQSCLLALIQQLSVELHKNTDLKLSFIRAAFLALSPEHSNTKQFIPKVLKELMKQLNQFMQTNPPQKHMTETRLLKMAVDSMMAK